MNWILDPMGMAHRRQSIARTLCGLEISQRWQPVPCHLPGEATICGDCAD